MMYLICCRLIVLLSIAGSHAAFVYTGDSVVTSLSVSQSVTLFSCVVVLPEY